MNGRNETGDKGLRTCSLLSKKGGLNVCVYIIFLKRGNENIYHIFPVLLLC